MGNISEKLCPRRPRPPKPSGPVVVGEKEIKIVLVGDASAGKTCLVINYKDGTYSE